MNLERINLLKPDASLYSNTAEETAHYLLKQYKDDPKNSRTNGANKRTQLRGFYDEIVTWDHKAKRMDAAEFNTVALPLIQMIRAKVAYAKGRGLVDNAYLETLNHCLAQVSNKDTLRNFKLFMEAVTGFLRLYDERK
jgi:CRISPR-associated protein Csm2